jgi:hypothetical protein
MLLIPGGEAPAPARRPDHSAALLHRGRVRRDHGVVVSKPTRHYYSACQHVSMSQKGYADCFTSPTSLKT